MQAFRLMLGLILVAIVFYTISVVMNHGLNLLPIFFGDIAEMAWPGQFNFDFLGMLMLSAFWVSWRNQFSPGGIGLGMLAFFLGAPFLTGYLLYLSYSTQGSVQEMLLGKKRSASLASL